MLFFKQNRGEGFFQGEENLIPQAFNILCGLKEDEWKLCSFTWL